MGVGVVVDRLLSSDSVIGSVFGGTGKVFLSKTLEGFGCSNCPYRGTVQCPVGLRAPEVHENGICSWRARSVLLLFAGIKNLSVKRLARDVHLLRCEETVEELRRRLSFVKGTGKLSKEERDLWSLLLAWDKELSSRRDTAISQDDRKEAVKDVTRVLSPVDLAVLLRNDIITEEKEIVSKGETIER